MSDDQALYDEVNINVQASLVEREVYDDNGDYVNTANLPTVEIVVEGPGVDTPAPGEAYFELSPDEAIVMARALLFAAGVDRWEPL